MKGDVGMKRRESRRYLHQDRKLFITPSLHLGVFSKSCLALKEHENREIAYEQTGGRYGGAGIM